MPRGAGAGAGGNRRLEKPWAARKPPGVKMVFLKTIHNILYLYTTVASVRRSHTTHPLPRNPEPGVIFVLNPHFPFGPFFCHV